MASAAQNRSFLLYAPIDGLIVPLKNVPDPVFSQESMGPGIAVEPLGDTFYAPAAGKIVQCAATKHAVAIEIAPDVVILLHLGIDTVHLNGKGLDMLVAQGQYVYRGDPLIRFDVDKVAQQATSLVTPLISIGEKLFSVTPLAEGRIAAHAPLARFAPVAAESGAA